MLMSNRQFESLSLPVLPLGAGEPSKALQAWKMRASLAMAENPPIDEDETQVIAGLIEALRAQTEALVMSQTRMNEMFRKAIEESNRLIERFSRQQ